MVSLDLDQIFFWEPIWGLAGSQENPYLHWPLDYIWVRKFHTKQPQFQTPYRKSDFVIIPEKCFVPVFWFNNISAQLEGGSSM